MAGREELPLLQEADDGFLGKHLQLQSGHDTAGDSSQAEWSQQWTNFGSEGDLEVFLFKLGDNKIRISTIFPEGHAAKQYVMKKMGRGFHLIAFDQSDVIEVINLDSLDNVTTQEGLILEAVPTVTACTEKVFRKTVKRQRTSTDWREETRPQIAATKKELFETEKYNSDLENEFRCLFAFLMGALSIILDRGKIPALLKVGKEKLTSARKDLISFVAQEKVKNKEKTNKRKKEKKRKVSNDIMAKSAGGEAEEQEVVDLGVALENAICSSAYLTKLRTYVDCQKTWMTTLQNTISTLEARSTKAAQNQEILQRPEVRLEMEEPFNVLTAPDFSGHPYKNDKCRQVLKLTIVMNGILNFLLSFSKGPRKTVHSFYGSSRDSQN